MGSSKQSSTVVHTDKHARTRRWILRRFVYFRSAFDFDPARTTIEITNERVTPELFTTVLRFAYTGDVPGAEDFASSDEVFQMFCAADYFQIDALKEQCVELFRCDLRPSNVIKQFILAHDYDLPATDFAECCEVFLEQNAAVFQKFHTDTLDSFRQRPDLLEKFVDLNQLLLAAL
jgi:hypothetical protein